MSKNFELLQEIGGDEGLFQTSAFDEPETAGAVAPIAVTTPTPNLHVDKGEPETVLPNAHLPSVLVPVEDASPSSSPQISGHLGGGEPAIPHLHETSAVEFSETSSSFPVTDDVPSPSTQDPKKSDELGEDHPDESADGDPLQPHRSILSLFPPTFGPLPTSNGCAPRISKSSFGLTWLDMVKAEVKHWIREATDKSKYQSCDWEAVAREEEIKLVRRVFPETHESLRRMALFLATESNLGCASVCARTAKVLASRGDGDVCLVDANFQSPSLHRYFGVENTQGLAEAAVESSPFPAFLREASDSGLWLMPCGQAASQVTFSAITDGVRRRMAELRDRFRYVVIHFGPVRREPWAMQISRWTDGVVIVLEANCTRRDTAKRIKETLLAANVNLFGVVLNNRTFPIPEAIYRKL
jgi:protein-tyrosine kinase